eukprot:188634_1
MASQFKSIPTSAQFPAYDSMNRMSDIYAANSQNMGDWVVHCKSLLMKMECTNIQTRSNHWSSIVNTQTHHTNHRLNIIKSVPSYKYTCDAVKHLSFLADWKGLKMRQITNYPRTYTEFEAKAKNWLNGRRAPNYGASLFPDMIKTAETYAHGLAEQVFGEDSDLFEPYFSVLMYAYLAALCSERITMNNASKRTPLLLENSLKYCKTPTAKMLQTYAQDYPYPHQFPSHLRQAADFFHSKYDDYMNRIYLKQNGNNANMGFTPNLHLKSALFASYKSNNNLIINELKMNKQHRKETENTKMKIDHSLTATTTNNKSETASHSDTSSASAITPIAPQTHEDKPRQMGGIPPPIPAACSSSSGSSTLSSNPSLPAPVSHLMSQERNQKMVQLTNTQYGALLSKIESLEHTQLQQRKVIACLAGKLQLLEDRNKVNQNTFMNHSIPPIPPIPRLHPEMMQSVPMIDSNENNNVMPTIDAPNNHLNRSHDPNHGFAMHLGNFSHFDAPF